MTTSNPPRDLTEQAADIRLTATVAMVGPTLVLDHHRERHCRVTVTTDV